MYLKRYWIIESEYSTCLSWAEKCDIYHIVSDLGHVRRLTVNWSHPERLNSRGEITDDGRTREVVRR